MKRRAARTTFSTAQLALWDELQAVTPQPPAQAATPAASAPHASAPAPAQPLHGSHGGRG
jgi:hypothetical protein